MPVCLLLRIFIEGLYIHVCGNVGEASGAHLLAGVSGTKAHLTPRTKDPSTESKRKFRPPSPQVRYTSCKPVNAVKKHFFQTQMIRGTVKDGSLPVMKEWLKVASSKGA